MPGISPSLVIIGIPSITSALFYAANVSNILLLFADAFDVLTDKIAQSVYNSCISCLLLHVCRKFYNNILNDCQDFANLLRGYFNLAHPV